MNYNTSFIWFCTFSNESIAFLTKTLNIRQYSIDAIKCFLTHNFLIKLIIRVLIN